MPDDTEPDPRWSLANERTLLAYNRTSLALVVAGIAVSGSHAVADVAIWVAATGLPLIALGAIVAGTASRRFTRVQQAMRAGDPLPLPRVAMLLPWGVAAVAVAALVAAAVDLL